MSESPPAQTFRRAGSDRRIANRLGSIPDIDLIARNSRIIWVTIAAMAVATIVAFWAANLSFAWTSAGGVLIWVAVFLAVSGFYRRFRPDPSITYGTECAAQLALVFALGCALSYPSATAGFPYRDAALNAVDNWMGLDWRAYLHFLNERPQLGNLARLAYGSVLFQSILLIVCLAGPSRLVRLQQYIFATSVTLIVTLAVFTFVPASGIYTFFDISPDEFANLSPVMTTDQIVRLDALRSGEHTLVSEMAGLVTFPSFHAAWGILFIWGFYPIRLLRHGAILLNLFMIATTPIQGAHYFIDLVGGIIVAVAAIHVAVRFMGGRERALRQNIAAQEALVPAVITPRDRHSARSLGGVCL
jgi:hypothetical protein